MALFFVGRFEGSSFAGNLVAAASGIAFAGLLLALRAPSMTATSRLDVVILGNIALVAVLVVTNVIRAPGAAFAPAGSDLARLLYLGVIQVGLAYVVYSAGIARIPALEASLVNMLEPVLNPAWVFLFLGERPGWWAALGGTIILAAIAVRAVLVERQARRSAHGSLHAAASI
jgi:drug/metabolite transporter (DMT)-like permease